MTLKNYCWCLLALFILLLLSCGRPAAQNFAKADLIADLALLDRSLDEFKNELDADVSKDKLIEKFIACRLAYKNVEWAIEYFLPETARFMNGPALDELEIEENKVFEPGGLQVIEELILSDLTSDGRQELIRHLAIMKANTLQSKNHFKAISLGEDYLFDALKQENIRILTLGITGFDSPLLQQSIPETAQALRSQQRVVQNILGDDKRGENLYGLLDAAITYCNKSSDFNAFDRSVFIRKYLNMIAVETNSLQRKLKITDPIRSRAVNPEAATVFQKDAFLPGAFVPSEEYRFTVQKAKLGERLFSDVSLSGNQTRSCATCHDPNLAFTDGRQKSIGLDGAALGRNSPTLTYAGLQHAQFWDMRQPDLEKQSVAVISDLNELHGSMEAILKNVTDNDQYRKDFETAFDVKGNIKAWQVQNAIASYIRSLNSFDSRFDRYMRGDDAAMTPTEVAGMNLFMGKAKCATCHFTPLFNGTVPPNYSKTEHEVIGTPNDGNSLALSEDHGRYIYNRLDQLKGAFKTPTLRNAAVTAPYMHNGVFRTLEEVVDFYNNGGGGGKGLLVPSQTLPEDKLKLSVTEKKALVQFIGSLTDKRYETPKLQGRKAGQAALKKR